MKLILIEDCNNCPYNDYFFIEDTVENMEYCPLMDFPIRWKSGLEENR